MRNLARSTIAFTLGLIAGWLVAWLYWQQRSEGHEIHIHTLQTLLREKERKLQKLKEAQPETEIAEPKATRPSRSRTAEPKVIAPSQPQAAESQPDDLKRIEGIGPKISQVLQAAGITTFELLAAADADQLAQILQDAKIRVADPTTWPEQARLAAAGDWKGLQALQARLKGGRRA